MQLGSGVPTGRFLRTVAGVGAPRLARRARQRPLRVLITNIHMKEWSGTHTVVRNLALGLKALGHEPMVYSPVLGEAAERVRRLGVPVSDQLKNLPRPDVIHGHHLVETIAALDRFKGVPGLFVCHDRRSWYDEPPDHPQVFRYVGIDLTRLERLREFSWVRPGRTAMVLNGVDVSRFPRRDNPPRSPRRALVFSNQAAPGGYLDEVRVACRELGLALDVVGRGSGTETGAPESTLPAYDIVFAIDQCAMEAMVAGCAVVLCGERGMGPLVTSDQVASLRARNFGPPLAANQVRAPAVVEQVRRYNAEDVAAVSAYMRAEADMPLTVARYAGLYDEIVREARKRLVSLRVRRTMKAMPRISDEQRRSVAIVVNRLPPVLAAGEWVPLALTVTNPTSRRLATTAPSPVLMMCQWRSTRGKVVPVPAFRAFQPALRPGETGVYQLSASAPDTAGEYTLEVTITQGGGWERWTDAGRVTVVASKAPQGHWT